MFFLVCTVHHSVQSPTLVADRELCNFFKSKENNGVIGKALAKQSIQWHFAPPKGSHFEALYESGMKSMKSLLHRKLGSATLTPEELNILLCQVEACLNSRPITAMSSDPSDLYYLTPGHFLIGGSSLLCLALI